MKKIAEQQVKKGKMSAADAAASLSKVQANLAPSSDLNAVKDCDVVVEAIVENLPIKKKFFTDLGKLA